MNLQVVLQGYLVSAGLIVAIGAQNAHVLRMGLCQQHVALTVALCALSDTLLMALGIAGMAALLDEWPETVRVATWLGAAFLFVYGFRALRAAITGHGAQAVEGVAVMSTHTAVLTALAFTFLNPHAYLDTIVLIGSVGGRLDQPDRPLFFVGCVLASASWFLLLGYGARWLVPLFAKPLSWRILDGCIGAGMSMLAIGLVRA